MDATESAWWKRDDEAGKVSVRSRDLVSQRVAGRKSRELIIGKRLEVDIKLTTRPAEYDRGMKEGQFGKGQELCQGDR